MPSWWEKSFLKNNNNVLNNICEFITCLRPSFLDRGAGTNLFLSYSLVDTGKEMTGTSTCANLNIRNAATTFETGNVQVTKTEY